MRTKEEIIGAYGKYNIWYELRRYINKEGWCRKPAEDYPDVKKEFGNSKSYWWRPIELKR